MDDLDNANVRDIEQNRYITVGERDYMLTLFAPSRGIKLAARLMKIIGEPLASMVSVSTAANPAEEMAKALPHAAKLLMARLSEEEVLSIINALLACVTRDKKQVSLDLEFQGRLGTLVGVLREVVDFQFKDFMNALGASIQGEMKDLTQ